MLMNFVDTATLCLKLWDAVINIVHVKKLFHSSQEDIQRGIKKKELDELRKEYIQEKGYHVIEMHECGWWKKYKTDNIVRQHLRESFP